MARRLNKRLLLSVLIFVGVPVAIVLIVIFGGLFSLGNPQEFYQEAKQAYEKEDYGQAWIAIRQAIKAGGGKDPEIQFFLGQVAMKQKPHPSIGPALGAYRAAVVLKPDYVEAQRNLTELYIAIRYWKEAKAETERLVELDPAFGRGYLWAAVVELGLADAEPIQAKKMPHYEVAAEWCRKGIEKAPDVLELYRLLAQVYERLDQRDKVEEVLNLAVANNATTAEAYILKASRLAALERADEASEVLKVGLEKAGQSPKLLVALGEVAIRRRDLDAARDYFVAAVEADPKDETGYLRLAGLYRMERDRDKAIAALNQGLAALPEAMGLLAQQADLYLEMNERQKADELIDRLEKGTPPPGVLPYLKGKRAVLDRQIRQAITYLEQARDEMPAVQSLLLLARAYMLAGELGSAQTELERIVNDNPRLTGAWRTLAEVQLRLRSYDRAARSAKIVLEEEPRDTEMRLLLAQTLIAQKRPQDALKEAQAAADQSKDDPDPYLLMAQLHRDLGRNDEAEAMYRRALEVTKDLAPVYQRFMDFYRRTSQKDKLDALTKEARKAVPEIALAESPEQLEKDLLEKVQQNTATPMDLAMLARVYQVTDRLDEASKTYEQVLEKAATDAPEWRQAWQQLFLLRLSATAYDQAAALVERLKQAEPEAPELLFTGPLLLLGQGKLDEAAAALQDVVEKHKSLSQAHFLLGQVLVRQEKWEQAIAALNEALKARPNLQAARLLLARVYQDRGNYALALTEATEMLKYDPRLVPALEIKAVAHAALGAWDAALAARDEITRVVPDSVNNLLGLAALYVQQHDPEKAEATYTRAYQIAPDNPMLVRAMADLYADTKRIPQGEKVLDDFISRHKDESRAYVMRGAFAAKVAGPEESEKYYLKAAELVPEDPLPLIFLGDEYSRIGQWESAAAAYEKAVARDKKSTIAKKRLGDVYMLQGDLPKAKAVIDGVIAADPNDASALVIAGRIVSRMDKREDALKYIEQALTLQPDYGEAKVRLAELYAGPDPMRALDILSTVKPTDLAFEKAMLLRAEINTRRVQLTEAILDLRRLLDFRPTSIPGRMQLAGKYMANREPGRAADMFEQLSKERMDRDPPLLVALGESRMQEGKFQDALTAFEKARALAPEYPESLSGEARALVSLKRKQEALERVQHVMNILPKEVWPRMALVAIYESSNELDKAFEVLRTGLLGRPDWESGYVYLANLLVRANRASEAHDILMTGVSKVPRSIPIRAALAALDIGAKGGAATAVRILQPLAQEFKAAYSLQPEKLDKLRPYMNSMRIYSLALYSIGQPKEALEWGLMLWQLDPTDVANANNVAWVLATEFKDYKRARDMIRQCMKLVPNNGQVLDTAGWIAFLEGNLEEANETLLASIKYGDSAEARYHLARVYEARQRPEEAKTEYQKAIDMGLAGSDLADAQKRLKDLSAS